MRDRYTLSGLLATGGMAEVYLGQASGAEGFQKPVVIKRVHPHLARDPRVARMFTAEARLASHLHHQNIVEVMDVGSGPDGLYLVMELVDGWDLGILLERAQALDVRFPPALAAYVASQALSGLIHAYKKQVDGKRLVAAHRDISPSNVLVSTEGEVKVADFGIARAEVSTSGTEPGTFKGKVAWAAPEQLRGELTDALSDQFSLGIVLYEMLMGRPPFGASENLVEYVARVQSPAPLELDGVPEALAQIVRTMLAVERGQRFANPELLAKALAQFLSRADSPASAADLQTFVQGLAPPPSTANRPVTASGALTHANPVQATQGFSLDAKPLQLTGGTHPNDELYDPNWAPQGVQMHASGRLTGIGPAPLSAGAPVSFERLSEVAALELAERVPVPEPELEPAPPPPKPRHGRQWALLAALAVLMAGGGWALVRWASPERAQVGRTHVLQISSEPEGAAVTIRGKLVGATPYLSENGFPPGEVEVMVSHHGYQPWHGHFKGGVDVELNAKLQRH